MAETKTYIVNRGMHGDGRDYARGDTREMSPADAAELVANGALAEKGSKLVEREPAVRHTFGQAPSEVNERGYTTASGEGLSLPRAVEHVPAKAAVKPAKPG